MAAPTLTPPPHAEPNPRRWYALFALVLSAFLAAMSISIINVALPEIGRTFSSSFSDLQWVSAAYTLVAASLTILAVKVADIYGRKRVFLVGMGGFTVGSLLCALAQSVDVVIAGRAIMGLGGAIVLPVALSIITVTFVGEELNTAVGIFSVSTISLVIGPIVGGWLVQDFNWRAVFWLNVVLGVIVVAIAMALLHESRKEDADRHIDSLGALFSIGMFFFLVLGLIKGQEWSWTGGKTLASFAAAAVCLILFVLAERRLVAQGREPLMDLSPFRIPTFDVAMLATMVANAGFAGFLFLLALLLQGPLGYDALASGLRYIPLMVGFVLIAPIVSKNEPRLGPRLLYGVGFGAFAIGTLLLTRLTPGSDWDVLIPGLLIAGIGCAIAQVETILGAVAAVPAGLVTMASGASAALRQVGSSIGVALFGSILTNRYLGSLPGTLRDAHVPAGVSTGILRSPMGSSVTAAGRIVPTLPAPLARAVQHGTHHAFVSAFNDTARIVALVLLVTMLLAVSVARRAAVQVVEVTPLSAAEMEQASPARV